MSTEVVLDQESARRVARAVRWVEQQSITTPPGPSRPVIHWPAKFAVTTSNIGAGNYAGGTLGSGTATLLLITKTVSGLVTTYNINNTGQSITVLNGGALIGSGRLIQVKVIDGFYVCDVDYC